MQKFIGTDYHDSQLPLAINDVGYQKVLESSKHKWPFYQIVCCYQGQGMVTIDGKAYHLSPGSVIYLSPNTDHEYLCQEKPYFLSWVSFYGYLLEKLPMAYNLSNDINHAVIQDSNHPEIHLQIMSILEHVDISYLLERTSIHMYGILIEFFVKYKYRDSLSHSINLQLIDLVIDWMKKNLHSPSNINSLALHLGISRQYLNRIFRQHFHTTAKDFFLKLKILQAQKDLIHFPESNVKDIAFELGFVNASHFTKVFQKVVGIAPTEYRTNEHSRRSSMIQPGQA